MRSLVRYRGMLLPQLHGPPTPEPAAMLPALPLVLALRNGKAGEKLQERQSEAVIIRLL